jgi:hypothetical protein
VTRIKSPHDFHEVKIRNPENICSNCSMETSQVCEWCGTCYKCHKGVEIEKEYELQFEMPARGVKMKWNNNTRSKYL